MPHEDLHHHPETNPGPLTTSRTWNIAELILLRHRDRHDTDSPEHRLLNTVAEDLNAARRSWESPCKMYS